MPGSQAYLRREKKIKIRNSRTNGANNPPPRVCHLGLSEEDPADDEARVLRRRQRWLGGDVLEHLEKKKEMRIVSGAWSDGGKSA